MNSSPLIEIPDSVDGVKAGMEITGTNITSQYWSCNECGMNWQLDEIDPNEPKRWAYWKTDPPHPLTLNS